ncbi:MAG: diguanylate cyclase [Desulfobacteraceae bacterium]|nr:diguanylate cyclase [Desulfobacteraceae bacterium]
MFRSTIARQTAKILLPGALAVALFAAFIFGIILPSFHQTMVDRKKEMLRQLTSMAWDILSFYQAKEVKGELSRREAQAQAIEQIRQLRYGPGGKDYFWINDNRAVMIMHPYRPDLDGRDLSGFADPQGTRLFREVVRVGQERGEGFVPYLWQWEDNPRRIVPKLSFVKEFPSWGWIVGTGVYLGDVERETLAITRKLTVATLAVLAAVALLSSYMVAQAIRRERKREEAEAELRSHRDQLDTLVKQRTAELTSTNQQLEKEIRENVLTREKLAASEEKFRDILENANDLVQSVKPDGTILYVNKAWKKVLGYDDQEIRGLNIFDVIHPDCRDQCREHLGQILAGEDPGRFEACFRTKGGDRIVVEGSVSCKFAEGKPQLTRGIFRDITARKAAEARIKQQNIFLHDVMESLPFPFYVVDAKDHTILLANSSAGKTGVGSKCYTFTHDRQEPCRSEEEHACPLEKVKASRQPAAVEHVHYDREGRKQVVEVHGYPVFGENGEVVQMIEAVLDITERKLLQEKLRHQSVTDELTGLLNRRGFLSMAEKQLQIADRRGDGLFLLYADLDHLKWINDTLGHSAGDQALATTAEILRRTFRKSDIIARLGGDEFTVLTTGETSSTSEQAILRRLQQAIEQTNKQGNLSFAISLSIGVAQYDPAHPRSLEKLMAEADSRMYTVKKGRGKSKPAA